MIRSIDKNGRVWYSIGNNRLGVVTELVVDAGRVVTAEGVKVNTTQEVIENDRIAEIRSRDNR